MTDRLSGELVAGPELDAMVAEVVFGGPPTAPAPYAHLKTPGNPDHWGYGPCDGFGPGGECSVCTGLIQLETPNYSTRIGAAVEVLDRFGGIIAIKRIRPDEWHVTITSGRTAWATTLPLAICRSALAASALPEPASVQPLPIEGP